MIFNYCYPFRSVQLERVKDKEKSLHDEENRFHPKIEVLGGWDFPSVLQLSVTIHCVEPNILVLAVD